AVAINLYLRLLALCAFLTPSVGMIGCAQVVEQLFPAQIQFAALSWRGARDGVGGQQREGEGGIGVDDDGVVEQVWLDLPPRNRLRWRRARQAAPVRRILSDLDEVIVSALVDAKHLPQLWLRLQVEVLRRATAQDDDAVARGGVDQRGRLMYIMEWVNRQAAAVELVTRQVHADG